MDRSEAGKLSSIYEIEFVTTQEASCRHDHRPLHQVPRHRRHRRGAGQASRRRASNTPPRAPSPSRVYDMTIPPEKKALLAEAEKKVDVDHRACTSRGMLIERGALRSASSTSGTDCTKDVATALQKNLDKYNPDQYDGRLRRPRFDEPDPPACRYARPDGQHRPVRQSKCRSSANFREGLNNSGILHLRARRPQGPGRHRAAYRRLGLSDPPSGRRLAGRHHPRGGLRRRHEGICGSMRSSSRRQRESSSRSRTACSAAISVEDVCRSRDRRGACVQGRSR